MTRPLRILVTGSRTWDDLFAIEAALLDALSTYTTIGLPVLVHGGCPTGADQLADMVWMDWEHNGHNRLATPERYPADRARHGRDAYRVRNQHMVDLGASICCVFAKEWASGSGMTARMARKAGIPTRDYGIPTALEDRP